MPRYIIKGRPYGHDKEVEICFCDGNPQDLVRAAQKKMLRMKSERKSFLVPKYEHVYFVDTGGSDQ